MTNRLLGNLAFAKNVVLTSAGMAAVATPIVLGILNAPVIRAQSSQSGAAVTRQKFEVASIRPCEGSDSPGGRGGSKRGGNRFSPGRMTLDCQSVGGLIQLAYSLFANGRVINLGRPIPIEGGPAWTNSERTQSSRKLRMMRVRK